MNIFQKAIDAGFSCVPCNGKKPVVDWAQYMKHRPSMQEAGRWGGNIAIVCGRVSYGLVCIDFDIKNGERFEQWVIDVNTICPEVLSKLYIETTPSGGHHVCYRSFGNMRSRKLAVNKDKECMIETRGEGGLFICAPSKGYCVYYGKLSTLRHISNDEEATLLAVAEGFNEYEKEEYKPINNIEVTGDSVFNRFDSITDPVPILQSHGWSVVYNKGNKVYLRRPNKKDGISASWNVIPDRFYCFSSSTVFEPETVYKPSAVYTTLEHSGNYRAACKELSKIDQFMKVK